MWDKFIRSLMIADPGDDPTFIETEPGEEDEFEEDNLPLFLRKDRHGKGKEQLQKKIQICRPKELEGVTEIIDHLLNGYCVMFNLEEIEPIHKQRMIDMVIGYCYSKDLSLKQVNQNIYFVCE